MPYALLPTTRRLNAPSFAPHSSLLLWLSHLVDSRRDENSTVHTSLRRAGTTSTKDRKLTMTYPAHCVRPFITPGLQQVSTQARNVDHRRFPNYLPTFYQGPPPERCFRLPLPSNGTVVESTRPRANCRSIHQRCCVLFSRPAPPAGMFGRGRAITSLV